MADVKYLVTVDSETGAPTKLELVGDSGELTQVDLSKLSWGGGNTGGVSIVVNIYGAASVNPQGDVKDRGFLTRASSPPLPGK